MEDQEKVYKHSEEIRAKWREQYQKNKEKLRPIKQERRRKYYEANKEIECARGSKYYEENREAMSTKSLIRYYRLRGDTDKVRELEEKLIGILEVGIEGA